MGNSRLEIKRDYYLNQLIQRKKNGLIKIITGIRRCGKSYLLNVLFKNHLLDSGVNRDHIIEMAFDFFENEKYRDPALFYPWAKEKIIDDQTYYFLLDETQLLEKFESVLNSLSSIKNVDIYVTGSNAKFLSKDIITEFGGRGDDIHMSPLSFREFLSVYPGNRYDGWQEYLLYGGIPLVVLAKTEEQKIALLNQLFNETYIRDVVHRNKIRNVGEMEDLLNFLSSAIGTLTNPSKLQRTFKTVKKSKITCTTITKYLSYLEDSFLVEAARRYDIKGKAYIETPLKYYFTDMGLRNARLHFRQIEPSHLMENIIYNELRIRGFQVDVGNLFLTERNINKARVKKQLEIDFVCNKGSRRYYIQSAYALADEAKREQEFRPFRKIEDSFKKIIITSDTPRPHYDEEGILIMNIYDFLLTPENMDY